MNRAALEQRMGNLKQSLDNCDRQRRQFAEGLEEQNRRALVLQGQIAECQFWLGTCEESDGEDG